MLYIFVCFYFCAILNTTSFAESNDAANDDEEGNKNEDGNENENGNKDGNDNIVICTSNKLVVKGKKIHISEILNITCLNEAKFIELFALDSIVIDENFDRTGQNVQLSIIAPKWLIIGDRKIILDGKNVTWNIDIAASGIGSYKDGKPGKPGGSAGCFLGIGNEFISQFKKIEIHVNGGSGGIGQFGGRGSDGVNGQDPPIPENSTIAFSFWDSQQYFYNQTMNLTVADEDGGVNILNIGMLVFGRNGTKPTRGGHGGVGGLGGHAGMVFFMGLQQQPDFSIFDKPGKNGAPGKGGFPGNQSRNGLTMELLFRDTYNMSTGESIEYSGPTTMVNETAMENMTASYGIDGGNELGIEFPEPVEFINPAGTINDFKSFVREYLANNSDENNLKQFLFDLDNNEEILSLYDTLGFVNELKDLGHQYIQLRDSISFTPFFESLRERIGKYGETFSESPENKGILRWLYTEVSEALTKLKNTKNNSQKTLVTNLGEYLVGAQKNIIKFSALVNEVKINKYQSEYQKLLDNQIKLAIKNIKNEIIPKMEQIFIEINSQVVQLIDELVERQYKYKIIEVDPEVIENLPPLPEEETISSFGSPDLIYPLKIIGSIVNTFASFAPNKEGQVTIEKLPNDVNSQNNIISSITENIQETMFKFKNSVENEYNLLLEQLNDIGIELEKNMGQNDLPFDVGEIQKKIFDSKSVLIEKIQSTKMDNSTEIDQIRKELKTYFKQKKSILEPTHRLLSLFEVIVVLLDFDNVPVFFYKQISLNYIEKLMNIPSVYPSINDTSYKERVDLEFYLENVYNQIVWKFEEMDTIVGEVKRNLTNHSYIDLEIIKWHAQITIRDAKAFFRRIGNETLVKENVYRTIEKLEDSVTALIGLYNQIDLMNIAKSINSFAGAITGISQYSSNAMLNDAILAVKYMIQRYLILEQYEIAMNAFKQHRFPFAHVLFSRFKLPADLEATDIQTMARVAVDHIDYLKEKTTLLDSTIEKYDHLIIQNVEFSSSETSLVGPFFTWSEASHGDNIKKLLNGEEIELEASIENGPNLSAIKYNEIGIYFKNADQSKQNNLNDALQYFGVTMTMSGKIYYKCIDEIYSFSGDDNIVIKRSFKRFSNGKPIMMNKVYQKLSQAEYFLSPYTTWKIKLTSNTDDFDKLRVFQNDDLNLELSGRGQYIQHQSLSTDICDKESDTHLIYKK